VKAQQASRRRTLLRAGRVCCGCLRTPRVLVSRADVGGLVRCRSCLRAVSKTESKSRYCASEVSEPLLGCRRASRCCVAGERAAAVLQACVLPSAQAVLRAPGASAQARRSSACGPQIRRRSSVGAGVSEGVTERRRAWALAPGVRSLRSPGAVD
jgi:hypothetical protein